MDSSNAPGPSSSSSGSSSTCNHQTSIGGTSPSWCSFDSVPPPTTSPDEEAVPSVPVGPFAGLSLSVDYAEGKGSILYEEPSSSLSLAVGKDEEVLEAFGDEQVPRTKDVFRRISNPEINLSHHQANGDGTSNSCKSKSSHRFFTLALPSSVPKERFKSVPPSSNNHASEDEEPNLSSPRNVKAIISSCKEEEISPSYSDSATEDAARISSNPLCSSQMPEHTLSDISGPCSSSIVEKVPVSFIGGREDGGECSQGQGSYVYGRGKFRSTALDTSTTTTTSSSSLSDSCETDELECRGASLVLSSKNGSFKDSDLPPPLEEAEEEEAVPMTVDTCEDYWTRLHDIRINGCILEYTGIGKSIHDNGFAQSNVPLTPLNHYFEITILDPGESCYIAIGLARKDYNMHKNPGWCRGSIGYHADDGKIFIGGGVGTPFGPRCTTNDILGCGVIFPVKYGELPEGTKWPWEIPEEEDGDKSGGKGATKPHRLPTRHRRRARAYSMDNFGEISSESEDDIWWNNKNQVCEDKVKVFFMRNRKLLGIKEVRIPKGGFYPTIGMMSTNERVSVDLHPLTG